MMQSSTTIRNNVQLVGQPLGTAPTLVMAHGFGSDQTAWRYLVEVFAADYCIVLFDHVGSGRSDFKAYSPHRYQTLHRFTQDFLDICQELDLRQITLIGHSVSCMVGLLAATVQPKRFKQLIFIGASPRYLNDGDYIGGFEESDLDDLLQAMAANYYAWASGFAPLVIGQSHRPELGIEFGKTLLLMRPDIAQAIARIIYYSDHRADLDQLTVPTIIIQPKYDIAVPVYVGEYLKTHIAHSQLILTDTEGHLPHLSSPEIIIPIVKKSLQTLITK